MGHSIHICSPPRPSSRLRCYNKVLQLRRFKGRAPDYEGILLYWLMPAKVRPRVAEAVKATQTLMYIDMRYLLKINRYRAPSRH